MSKAIFAKSRFQNIKNVIEIEGLSSELFQKIPLFLLENPFDTQIKELKIHGSLYCRCVDIVGFVNGIPLLFASQ